MRTRRVHKVVAHEDVHIWRGWRVELALPKAAAVRGDTQQSRGRVQNEIVNRDIGQAIAEQLPVGAAVYGAEDPDILA